MFVVFLAYLLPSAIYVGNLQDLVSASNNFGVQKIDHEHVLGRNPAATELAASMLKDERGNERFFLLSWCEGVPTHTDMATGKAPKTPELGRLL
jgi:hypothetical protein